MQDKEFSLSRLRELDEMFESSHNIEEQVYYFDDDEHMTDKEHATHGIILKIDKDTGRRISEDRFSLDGKNLSDEDDNYVIRF